MSEITISWGWWLEPVMGYGMYGELGVWVGFCGYIDNYSPLVINFSDEMRNELLDPCFKPHFK